MKASRIVIHCSDSNFGDSNLISKWHEERGFKTIGYHYVICNGILLPNGKYEKDLDGKLEEGRPLDMPGAHTLGYNRNSIGVCLIGRTTFTLNQLKCLLSLIVMLRSTFPEIAVKRVQGHNELTSKKTCPNFDVRYIRELLKIFINIEA
jgi:N-acetylmuramoyl-L-alanine amidase